MLTLSCDGTADACSREPKLGEEGDALLRILLLSNLFPPFSEGGAEVLAGGIVAELERLGHEVVVLTSSHGVGRPRVDGDGRVLRLLRLAPPVHYDRRRPVWQQAQLAVHYLRRYHAPRNAAEIRRVMAQCQAEVVYVWEMAGTGVTSVLHALADIPVPIVYQLGSYWLLYARSPQTPQSRLRLRWLKRWLIGSVPPVAYTSLIAVSERLKQEYAQAGFDGARIEVIHNGVNPRFLCSPAPDRAAARPAEQGAERATELLFVGRLRREKGANTLLKALDLLIQGEKPSLAPGARPHLTIIGDGDPAYTGELEGYVKERRLEGAVTFRGRLAPEELVACYDQADIMMVPSLWEEPFGLVAIEAMARGLPVIASRVGGLAEIITHDVTGILTAPGDARELAAAIAGLVARPLVRLQLGQAAAAMVRERFTIARNAAHIAAHLQRALATST